MSTSIEKFHEYLNYDPDTGVFTWIKKSSKNVMAGSIAGTVKTTRTTKDGLNIRYRYIKLDGEYPAARLAWAMHYGEWPQSRVRFNDGDSLNLRIDNLALSNSIQGDHDHSTSQGRSEYMKEYTTNFPDRNRNSQLQRTFGIDLNDYIRMAVEQNNLCAICGRPETQKRGGKVKALSVDHNHTTGAIRGLLCSDCNTGLGKLQDSQTVLYAAIAYLDRHVVK
jgi:hypothetical protein